jgi:hypothetical protein
MPALMFVLGLGYGAGHWRLATMPVTFALIFPLVLLAAVVGTFSANLGLMLVLGYASGDLLWAGPPDAWAVYYRGPVAHFLHLTIPQLVSYLLFFMLAALPVLNTRLMLRDLVRREKFKRPNGWPATAFTVLSVTVMAAIQGAFVYTWTFTAPMIFRLSWLWAGQRSSPINITYFQNVTVPWLPIAAIAAFLVRCWLEYRVTRNPSASAFKDVLAASQRLDSQARTGRPVRALETLFAVLVVTLLSSGFFWSIRSGVIFLLIVAALFYVRAFVLPKRPAWQAWAEKVRALSIVVRLGGAMAASFFVTRLVLSLNLSRFSRFSPIFKNFSVSISNKYPVDFWVELMCIALGLAITLALLPEGAMPKRAERAPAIQATPQAGFAYRPQVMLLSIGIVNFCLDPFCCFGASDLLVALMIAALLWEMLPFLLMFSEIAVPLLEGGLATLAGDAGILGVESIAALEEEAVLSPYELRITEALRRNPKQMAKFVEAIKTEGKINETIKYVEFQGEKYIVDGHHRIAAAKILGYDVPVEQVSLPFGGYRIWQDLLR